MQASVNLGTESTYLDFVEDLLPRGLGVKLLENYGEHLCLPQDKIVKKTPRSKACTDRNRHKRTRKYSTYIAGLPCRIHIPFLGNRKKNFVFFFLFFSPKKMLKFLDISGSLALVLVMSAGLVPARSITHPSSLLGAAPPLCFVGAESKCSLQGWSELAGRLHGPRRQTARRTRCKLAVGILSVSADTAYDDRFNGVGRLFGESLLFCTCDQENLGILSSYIFF